MRLRMHLITVAVMAICATPAAAALSPTPAPSSHATPTGAPSVALSAAPGLRLGGRTAGEAGLPDLLGADLVGAQQNHASALPDGPIQVAQRRVRRGERRRQRRAERRAQQDRALERRRSKSRRRKRIRNGIAIGVGAAVLGAIIANAARDRQARANERAPALEPLPPRDPAPRVYADDEFYDDGDDASFDDDYAVAEGRYEGRSYERNKRRCADRFNSFDWDTDTIIARTGDVVLCPYLR